MEQLKVVASYVFGARTWLRALVLLSVFGTFSPAAQSDSRRWDSFLLLLAVSLAGLAASGRIASGGVDRSGIGS